MNNFLTERNLSNINFIIVIYFVLIYIQNFYNMNFVSISVFKEILTIPFLLAQFVFLFFSIKFLIKENKRNIMFITSSIFLAACTGVTISSFF